MDINMNDYVDVDTYYGYEYATMPIDGGSSFAMFGTIMTIVLIISLILTVISFVAMWKLYEKAGFAGWVALIPVYNIYVLYYITWGKGVYMFLMFIPLANFAVTIITAIKLAKAFGKSGGFAVGLIFLNFIFMLILAFDKNTKYVGPCAE